MHSVLQFPVQSLLHLLKAPRNLSSPYLKKANCFRALNLSSMAPKASLVDSPTSIASLIDSLADLPVNPPPLYFDVEGIKISRHGSVSILQLYVLPLDQVYLVDIHVLGEAAFTTTGIDGKSLKDVLESTTVPKVCFDVRNDSNALFFHFGIALQYTHDVQLMEIASRRPTASKRYLNGLQKCITDDATIAAEEKQACATVKEKGARLFAPERGGSHEVFNVPPLRQEIWDYCVQDVVVLPLLFKVYQDRLQPRWETKVGVETTARIQTSQKLEYQPYSDAKRFGPW